MLAIALHLFFQQIYQCIHSIHFTVCHNENIALSVPDSAEKIQIQAGSTCPSQAFSSIVFTIRYLILSQSMFIEKSRFDFKLIWFELNL